MVNKKISDVFFDLDHTLWDFDRNSRLAFQRVFQKHNIVLGLDAFLKEYEPINLEYWRHYSNDSITKQELRRGRLIDTFGLLEMDMSLEIIDLLAKTYIDELPKDNYLFADALEILNYLNPNYNLHIITNGFHEVQHLKLKNSGIEKYFRTITTWEDAGIKKPHPDIFKHALRKAYVEPDKSIMIGDSLEADIKGAKDMGMHTLFFNYRNEVVGSANYTVGNLLEIKNYL